MPARTTHISWCTVLFVDYRSGSRDVLPLLGESAQETDLGKLGGDVVIPGNGPEGGRLVAIEMKRIEDLLQSEGSGKLGDTQLRAMFENYQEIWLLTMGRYRAGTGGRLEVFKGTKDYGKKEYWKPYSIGGRQVPYSYLESFLVEIQAMGVHLKQVDDLRMAAYWLLTADRWWSKEWSEHRAMKKFDRTGE